MAKESNVSARVQHKHDTEVNWNKATTFIPKAGELIIYDIDSTHEFPRMKIGDGSTTVVNLKFIEDQKTSVQIIHWDSND